MALTTARLQARNQALVERVQADPGKWWALCISLCTGVHSARPLNPGAERKWWGAWIRPRPPYVQHHRGAGGVGSRPQRSGGEGSADGQGQAGTERQNTRRTDREDRQNGNGRHDNGKTERGEEAARGPERKAEGSKAGGAVYAAGDRS